MEIIGSSNVVLLRLGGSCQCSSDDLVSRMDHVRAVALIIEEMGCKPPHVATDKTDIDQVWKYFPLCSSTGENRGAICRGRTFDNHRAR
ncbi:unnamed protein product, partial [Musa textilis]